MRKDYVKALAAFQASLERLVAKEAGRGATAQKLLVSISTTYHQLERYDEATASFAEASAIDAEKVGEYSCLGRRSGCGEAGGASEGRAAEGPHLAREVLFAEDEQLQL